MSEPKSHRIWGIVYFDPDDSRLVVPRPYKLGWDLNFGHPRAATFLAWLCAVLLLAFVAVPVIAHPLWFAREPADIAWWGLATLTAVGMIRLNQCFTWSDYRNFSLASFGILATGIGFPIQMLINAPLMFWWGTMPTLPHHLVLGSVAAAAQTFGKWCALFVLFKARPLDSPLHRFRNGLLIGLGFTVLEITMIYFKVAWSQVAVDYLSLWERASSSMFHIYSTGLIAASIGSRRYWPILLVVGTHALTDILAGAGGTLGLSIYSLESIFSVCAILVWVTFLLTAKASHNNGGGVSL